MSKTKTVIFTVLIHLIKMFKSSKVFLVIGDPVNAKVSGISELMSFRCENLHSSLVFYLTNFYCTFLGPEYVLFQAFLSSSAIFVIAKLTSLHQVEVKLTWDTFTTNTMGFMVCGLNFHFIFLLNGY